MQKKLYNCCSPLLIKLIIAQEFNSRTTSIKHESEAEFRTAHFRAQVRVHSCTVQDRLKLVSILFIH